ncbi:MAG: translation initiation factor IF-2 [Pelagibacterales bacterium]|nr:translation initiation factor IF-2 [Pelagibacterales bacterium]OUV27841.1 MAG: translation initiation factor IF-2 [Alphaproteobacteria bacterium TMED109]
MVEKTPDTKKEEENSKSSKKLGFSSPRLELKKTIGGGTVRQSFSHGRTKSVSVEVKKVRSYKAFDATKEAQINNSNNKDKGLSEEETEARLKAINNSIKKKESVLEEKIEEINKEPSKVSEENKKESKKESNIKEKEINDIIPAPLKESDSDKSIRLRKEEEAEEKKKSTKKQLSLGRDFGKRRQKKLSINQAFEDEERQRSLASVRRAREREKRVNAGGGSEATKKIVREVTIPEVISVQELANRMATRSSEIVKSLMKNGVLATATQTIDGDTAELVVIEFGHTVKRVSDADVEIGLETVVDSSEGEKRPPVVTVMGHVDHGKTSLLDAIRSTDIVSKESGGITQHIGAYQIETKDKQIITFIDTPGHAAFSAMRARGANITDIVVLVVAADDSVMPQTIEAIQHALEAKAPIVLAINKIDTPGSNPLKVKQDLLQHNVITEDVGGEVVAVEVSALKKTNIDELLSVINLQSELLELKAVKEGDASGVVVESRVDAGRGVVATLLVSRGTLKIGDIVVAGANWGRVKALLDYKGDRRKLAVPSEPVEILGLNSVPQAGDQFAVVKSESRAREVSEYRQSLAQKNNPLTARTTVTNVDQMLTQIKQGQRKALPIILKTDVNGSMEAISAALRDLQNDEVTSQIILSGVGALNESDIMLAVSSGAIVVAFNVRADAPAKKIAKQHNIEIKYYSIIYNILDDIKNLLSGLMAPIESEVFLGYAKIKKVFKITKIGKIAGCEITEGVVKKNIKVRLLRENVVIHEGDLSTLKHHQKEVDEVKEGMECGMALENYEDIKEGDLIECFEIKTEIPTLK